MNLDRQTLSARAAGFGAAAYYGGLRTLHLPGVSRWLLDAGIVLCYHNVVAAGVTGPGTGGLHITCDHFERQMRWLATHYDVLPLGEFAARLETRASLNRTAVITFDDAYAGVFEHAVPRLRALDLPATIFVVAEAPDRPAAFWWDGPEAGAPAPCDTPLPADWNTIRAGIGRGIDIGVHSSTHASLPALAGDALDHEIVESRRRIQRATGIWAESFAYPYGHWDRRVRAAVRDAGYRVAVTTDSGLNDARANRWSVRRTNIPAGITDAAFEAWTAGLNHPWRRS